MTPTETARIMTILQTAYPAFYRNQSRGEMQNAVALWAEMFRDDDAAVVAVAVKAMIAADDSGGFPPNIGQVKAKIRKLTQKSEMTEGEAWSLVSNALRNSLYGAKEEFEKLPDDVKRIVHSPSQLREWAMMDSETVHSVLASNFQRSYRAISAQKREYDALPNDVKAVLSSAGTAMLKG